MTSTKDKILKSISGFQERTSLGTNIINIHNETKIPIRDLKKNLNELFEEGKIKPILGINHTLIYLNQEK